MVHFDQAFIPVYTYAYEGDIYQAKRAVFFLEFQWQKLRNQYEGYLAEEAEAMRRIDAWLGDAYYAIDANRMQMATSQLEHVKYEFMMLRETYGLDYYLDRLFDFQADLELLTEAANDEMLCLMEWDEYEFFLEQTRQEWASIQKLPFDAELYEFDAAQLRQLRTQQKNMEDVLKQYTATLGQANRQAIAEASRELQPAFFELLKLFGKFEASRSYFAKT